MGDLNSLSLHSLPKSKLPRKAFLTQKDEHGGLLRSVSKESPEFDVLLKGHTSQATLLLRKRNELREVNDLLIQKKEEHRKRIEECNYKMIEFDLKLSKHREEKVRFEAFIQENIAKRLRSELKYKNEHQLYEDKCKHILQLTEKLKEMESHVKSLSADIVKKKCYKEYLDRFVGEGRLGYEEVVDILNRHRVLRESNQDLMRHVANQDTEVDAFRSNLYDFKVEKENQILISNNMCQNYREELDRIRSEVSGEEEKKELSEDRKKDLSRELSEVASSIRNMFNRCQMTVKSKQGAGASAAVGLFSGNGRDSIPLAEVLENNLEVIMARIVDLKEIKKEYAALEVK